MNDEPFGRQLKPVTVEIHGADQIDRTYWADRLKAWLNHQPCTTTSTITVEDCVVFHIHPDANND